MGGRNQQGETNRQEGSDPPSRDFSTLGGDLVVVVELVERTSTEMIWTGVLELPMPKSGSKDPASAKGLIEAEVKHLLEPLPNRKNGVMER